MSFHSVQTPDDGRAGPAIGNGVGIDVFGRNGVRIDVFRRIDEPRPSDDAAPTLRPHLHEPAKAP